MKSWNYFIAYFYVIKKFKTLEEKMEISEKLYVMF